jgi:transcriptional regulator with XRE-family HTH domain
MSQQGYGQRIKQAILDLSASRGAEVTYGEVGRAVAVAEGRPKPYSSSAVSEWIQERSEPTIRAFRAMEAVFGKGAAWLMALDATPAAPRTSAEGQARYGLQPPPKPAPTKKAATKAAGGGGKKRA